MNKEHNKRLKEIFKYAVDCHEYLNISEVFSLPFKYRQVFMECVNKHIAEVNEAMKK